jgi:hypothetical protein
MSKNGAQSSKTANQASTTVVVGPGHQGKNEVTNFGKMMSHNSRFIFLSEFPNGTV